jgi:hypothetical protein
MNSGRFALAGAGQLSPYSYCSDPSAPAPWSAAWVFRALPLPLRDRHYELVACNRLRRFGRRDRRLLSAPRYEDRFLS